MTAENSDTEPVEDSAESPVEKESTNTSLPRRSALALLGITGLGVLSGQATAAPPAKAWKRDQDADGNHLFNLGGIHMEHKSEEITDFEGDGLRISDSELAIDFEALLDDPLFDIGQFLPTAGRYLEFDEEENELNFTGSAEWSNEYQDAENVASGEASVVGGGEENEVTNDHGTVSGGENNTASQLSVVAGGENNTATGESSTVSGGTKNSAESDNATVGGGRRNTASEGYSTVGGGDNNTAEGVFATVSGGRDNNAFGSAFVGGGNSNIGRGLSAVCGGEVNLATKASFVGGGVANGAAGRNSVVGGGHENSAVGMYATTGGGHANRSNGEAATVPGGMRNAADGDYSVAAGRQANANHAGTFVVGNSSEDRAESENADEVRFQAGGGFVIEDLNSGNEAPLTYDSDTGELLVDNSSTRYKEAMEPLDPDPEALLELEPRSFEYTESGRKGIGLIAEEVAEFVPELVITDDEGRPDAVRYDRLGVYLIAELRRQRDENAELRERLAALEEHVGMKAAAADGGSVDGDDN